MSPSTSTARTPARCGSSSSPTRLLDRGVPPGRPAAGRHPADLRRLAGAHPGGHRPTRAARRRGPRTVLWWRRTSRRRARLVRPTESGGYGLDALWNDDFHHSAMVALTGRNEAYYTDYLGTPQEFISAVKYGYLYQGQRYKWQKKRRGTPAWGWRPAFVTFIQNHDQIANSGRGIGAHADQPRTAPGHDRAHCCWGPARPCCSRGRSSPPPAPFFFFADHKPELAKLMGAGRAEFLAQFPSLATPEMQSMPGRPGRPRTFERSKLDLASANATDAPTRCIGTCCGCAAKIRSSAPTAGRRRWGRAGPRGLRPAFLRRERRTTGCCWSTSARDLHLDPAPEPLLAPPEGTTGRSCGRAKTPAMAAPGRPARRPKTTGASPAMPRWCCLRPPRSRSACLS